MLQLKYLFENYDLAKECLKNYDYSEQYLDKMLSYFRISSNAIYPFYADEQGKVCFLRLAPAEEKSLEEVRSEIHFICWLIDKGYPAMKPYPMKNGRLCDELTTRWGTYQVSCFEKVPGETLEDTEGTPAIAFGYGKALAELHCLSAAYPYADERRSWQDLLAETRRRFEIHRAPACAFDYLNSTETKLQKLPTDARNFGLVHYDFEPDNVLYSEKTGRFGVIDFDDTVRCWFALDIARALDAMGDVVAEEAIPQATDAFWKGYRSVRDFSEEDKATLPLMRDLVRLQAYATILHVTADAPTEEIDWLIQVKAKLQAEQKKIEDYISGLTL